MKTHQNKHTLNQIKLFGNFYLKGNSIKATADHFKVSKTTMAHLLTRYGYRTPSKKYEYKRIHIDYFNSIDNHEKAYYLGLIYSDGYICRTDYGKQMGIALQSSDAYILNKLHTNLKLKNKLGVYKNSTKLIANSISIYEDLYSLGVREGKSNIEFGLPPISEEYINSFILGYFDGDGCITIKTSKAIVVSFCCNSHKFLLELQQKLLNYGIQTRPITKSKNRNLCTMYLSKRINQLKLMDFMYKDSPIFLYRKYNKFLLIPR